MHNSLSSRFSSKKLFLINAGKRAQEIEDGANYACDFFQLFTSFSIESTL